MSDTVTVGITGAAGYIGSRVTHDVIDAGYDVVPIDNFSEGDVESIRGVEVRDVDVRDRRALREVFADVEAILHLGAISGVPDCEEDPERAFDSNVGGTENVAWLCREWGTPLVFPCSMAVIGDPTEFPISADHPRRPKNHYGRTKAMSEADIHSLAEDAFPAHVFLKSNLYGFHEVEGRQIGKRTVTNIFVEQALDGEPLTVHEPGTQSRDFIHVKDVARGYVLALERLLADAAAGETGATSYTLASGDCRSVKDIAETVQRIVEDERDRSVEVTMVENPRDVEETEVEDFTVDTSAADDIVGFEAEYDVDRAVREMVREEAADAAASSAGDASTDGGTTPLAGPGGDAE